MFIYRRVGKPVQMKCIYYTILMIQAKVIILFEIEDLQKGKRVSRLNDLRERMQEGGVIDKPDIYFLTT